MLPRCKSYPTEISYQTDVKRYRSGSKR